MGVELERVWGGEKTGAGAWRISKVAPLGDIGSGIIDVWPVLAVFHLNMSHEVQAWETEAHMFLGV